jgi:SAM-dependent methyltransferase
MQEYLGKTAVLYKQFSIRVMFLNPVVKEIIIKYAGKGKRLLDVACGDGYFYETATGNSWKYTGIDLSQPLLEKAKTINPGGEFLFADAKEFSSMFAERFDLILNIMLLPVFKNRSEIIKNIKECKKVLNKNGRIIVATGHPCFDSYMQYGLVGRDDVVTNFTGYFGSPSPYVVTKKTEGGMFEFHDTHFTLQDHFTAFKECGFKIDNLVECKVREEMRSYNEKTYLKKKNFPTFIVFELVKEE